MVDEQEKEATPQETGAAPAAGRRPWAGSPWGRLQAASIRKQHPTRSRSRRRPARPPGRRRTGSPRGTSIPYRQADTNQPGGANRPQGAGAGAARPPQGPRPPFNGTIQPVGPAQPGVPGQAPRPPMRPGGFRPQQPLQGQPGGPGGPRPGWVDLGRKPSSPAPRAPTAR